MKPGERTRRKGVEQRFGLWRWRGAGIAAFAVGLGWAAQAALVRSMQPPCQRAGWRHSHAAAPRLSLAGVKVRSGLLQVAEQRGEG